MSTNSPSTVPILGILMWRRKLLSGLNFTQAQVRVAVGSSLSSQGDSSSPIRMEPKKASRAAVHMFWMVSADQPEVRSLWPRWRRIGMVTTLLVLVGGLGEDMRRFPAPRRKESTMLSLISKEVNPLSLCRHTRAEK